MNPLKLFQLSYLFDKFPGPGFIYFWPLLIFFAITFIGSFPLKKKFPKLPEHIPGRIREFSLLGLLLTFLRDQNVPLFGMRFWLVFFFILMAVYALWSWRKYKIGLREEAKAKIKSEVKDKYLPTAKKRKKKKR